MAEYDDIQKARIELEKLNKEYKQLTGKKFFDVPTEDLALANTQITDFGKLVKDARREASGLSSIFGNLNEQLKANLSEIDKANSSLNMGKRAYREIVNTVRQLADEEAGIDRISFSQLKKLKSRSKSALEETKLAGERLAAEKGITKNSDLSLRNLSEYEEALLRAYQSSFKAEERANRFVGYRLDLERKVLDTVKLTGGALNGVSNLASSLGLQGFAESLEEIKGGLDDDLRKSIRKAAEQRFDTDNAGKYAKAQADIVSATKEINDLQEYSAANGQEYTLEQQEQYEQQTDILKKAEDFVETSEEGVQALYEQVSATKTLSLKFKALGKAAKEFADQLSDPLFVIGSMVKGYLAIDEAATAYARTTGQNVRGIAALNDSLVTSVENMELMSMFAERTGMNINNLFDSYSLARITEAGKLMGVGAEGAAKLAQNIKLSNVPLGEFQDAAMQGGKEVIAAGGAGLNLGKILQDASTTSDAIALSLGNNPLELARASAEAQRLGMNLDQIDSIANSMLDFESSIQHELEAQLLTGKQINLSKAREAALNNDMAALAREISENNALSSTFSTSNRIQQEAMAKALGMSRNDLAKMVALDMLRDGISADVVANQMKMSKEQLLQMSVQDKFNTAVGKLQQSLAPILDIFAGLISGIADMATGIGETFGYFSNFVLSIRDGIREFLGLNDGVDQTNKSLFSMTSVLKTIGNILGGILIIRFLRMGKLAVKFGKKILNFSKDLQPFKKMLESVAKLGTKIMQPFKFIGDVIKKLPEYFIKAKKQMMDFFGVGGAKATAEIAEKGGANAAGKGAAGIAKKVGAKGAMKLGGKALSKLLPGVGLAFALDDFISGDITGGILNTLAGIASFFPGIGTAISGILTAVDIGRDLAGYGGPTEMAKGGVVTKATNIIAGEAGAEAIIPLDKLPSMMSQPNTPQLSLNGLNAKFDEMINKLDVLATIKGDVYIDGYKAGKSIFAASNNLPS